MSAHQHHVAIRFDREGKSSPLAVSPFPSSPPAVTAAPSSVFFSPPSLCSSPVDSPPILLASELTPLSADLLVEGESSFVEEEGAASIQPSEVVLRVGLRGLVAGVVADGADAGVGVAVDGEGDAGGDMARVGVDRQEGTSSEIFDCERRQLGNRSLFPSLGSRERWTS
jgi:hypothetical protein